MFKMRVMPGAEPWAPTRQEARQLGDLLAAPVVGVYWPRARGVRYRRRALLAAGEMDRAIYDSYFSVRGWTPQASRTFHFLCDPTETKESVLWGSIHELVHTQLPILPLLSVAFREMDPKKADYYSTDRGHDARNEERLANLVADLLAPIFGIRGGYDRTWWRDRVRRFVG